MGAGEPLGQVEFAVLAAVHRGALRSRCTAEQVRELGEQPAGEALLHDALHQCEQDGLVRSERDRAGRRYELTAAGRARLRLERRFRLALVGALLRSSLPTWLTPAVLL
jgi:DNA-binding PadR family transcriptional regulator